MRTNEVRPAAVVRLRGAEPNAAGSSTPVDYDKPASLKSATFSAWLTAAKAVRP